MDIKGLKYYKVYIDRSNDVYQCSFSMSMLPDYTSCLGAEVILHPDLDTTYKLKRNPNNLHFHNATGLRPVEAYGTFRFYGTSAGDYPWDVEGGTKYTWSER